MLKQKLLTAAIALAISGVALADTVYVTNEADSGTGSFRAAVDAASGTAAWASSNAASPKLRREDRSLAP